MIIPGLGGRGVLALPALMFFGLFLTSLELLHAHRTDSIGLYSAECPLAELAARHGEASLTSASPIVTTWWAVGPAPAIVADQVAASFSGSSTDSRAPPLA